MKIRKSAALAAVVALSATALVGITAAPATAATKVITIWADDQRGPQLKSLLQGNTSIAPGYKIDVKFYASLEALQSAWDKASAEAGPDIITGPASFIAGAKSGKLIPLTYSATNKKEMPSASINALSFGGKTYGVALDVDTTAFVWNKAFGKAPATMPALVNYYKANKTSKGLTGGICAFEGTWGSHGVLTAFGGGAWAYKGVTPKPGTVLLNSKALKTNMTKYLLGSDGKSNGFFQWDGCAAAFKAGTIPAAITGAWNYSGIADSNIDFSLSSVPGMTTKTKGQQWVNYSGAFVTSYSKDHGVSLGAKNVVLKYFASRDGQLSMSVASGRPPANIKAAAAVTNPYAKGVAKAAATGTPQNSPWLDDKTGGSNWYDVLGNVYDKILVKGEPVGATLDAGAAILKTNFANASK